MEDTLKEPDRLHAKPCDCSPRVPGSGSEQAIPRRALMAGSAIVAASYMGFPARAADTRATKPDPIVQPQNTSAAEYIRRAFEMRQKAVDLGDQAYGAVVVRDKLIIGQSWSRVVLDGDPTAHAEMAAIKDAAMRAGSARLRGAVMYSSSRPCPMCEAACYWAGIREMVYGKSVETAGSPTLCG